MGIGGFSFWKVAVILTLLILLFGGKRVRSLGADLGELIKGFRDSSADKEKAATRQGSVEQD